MRRSRIGLGLALLLVWVVVAPSANAICETVGIVSSLFPVDSGSYIETPGVEPGPGGSSVSATVAGVFWAVGSGHPDFQQGNDSGTFPGIDWIQRLAGYAATFNTTWAASPGIDGCIRAVGNETCTAVLLSDQSDGRGYFALLTAAPVARRLLLRTAGQWRDRARSDPTAGA